jgi:creatinine amidohydrolase
MNPPALTYEQLEHNCIAWSQAQPDIRAALVVGSRARINHPADEWSDLDLVLFTTTPAIYAIPATGLREIGEIWASVLSRTGRGDPEWRVMLAGGLKADFVFTLAVGATLSQMMEASPYAGVYERGVRVLFDKSPVQARVDFQRRPPTHPTQVELEATVKRVWLSAGRMARFVRRGDLWRAAFECNGELKEYLLTLLEWHARATRGLDHDTWHDGRFMEEWADPRALEALAATFARYDGDSLRQALFATLDLCRRLAQEVAGLLGYADPTLAEARVTDWIHSILSSREEQRRRPRKGVLLQDLTWMEAEKILTDKTIVVIPLGAAAKEHGPHLKLKNDWMLAEYMTERVLQEVDVVIAPTVGYHFYPAFIEYPGSISLRLETARDLIMDICTSLARYGPRRFYVLNTGVSTLRALEPAARALAEDGILLRYTNILQVAGPVEKALAQQEGGTHADEIETSMMLHIAPNSVDMRLAAKDYHPGQGGLTRDPNGQGAYSPTGIYGDATLATREKGEQVIEAIVAGILQDIEALRQSDPGLPDQPIV